MYRVGLGSDIHPFESGRKLFLGGVQIESNQGLKGHSDADVVLHAIGDALLGALALGDLGEYFPGDAKNKDRDSKEILREITALIWSKGYTVNNLDVVIMAEVPKISPHKDQMREVIAGILNIEKTAVGIKATTSEKLGSIGRSEGIFAQAVVMLVKSQEEEE